MQKKIKNYQNGQFVFKVVYHEYETPKFELKLLILYTNLIKPTNLPINFFNERRIWDDNFSSNKI